VNITLVDPNFMIYLSPKDAGDKTYRQVINSYLRYLEVDKLDHLGYNDEE
jgi:hypothetical protein